jgi:hypothetical protein
MSKSILFSLIGKETTPNYRAYKEFKPEVLVHIYSNETFGASEILVSMVDKAKTKVILIEVDGDNYNDVISKLNDFDFEITKKDHVSINITGGTKMMALAIVEFSKSVKSENLDFFYIDWKQNIQWYLENKVEDFCDSLELDEFVKLKGQKIKSKDTFLSVFNKYENSINEIKEIVEDFGKRKQWDKFLELFVSKIRKLNSNPTNKDKSIYVLHKKWLIETENKSLEIVWDTNSFKVFDKDVLFLELEQSIEEIEWFIFNAGWFELLTALKFSKKYEENKIFMNVTFPVLKNVELDKNEVDILINDGGKLIFVECKSGLVLPDAINSMKVRQETYGGQIGKSVLVTRYDLLKDKYDTAKVILDKCEDLNIEILTYSKL